MNSLFYKAAILLSVTVLEVRKVEGDRAINLLGENLQNIPNRQLWKGSEKYHSEEGEVCGVWAGLYRPAHSTVQKDYTLFTPGNECRKDLRCFGKHSGEFNGDGDVILGRCWPKRDERFFAGAQCITEMTNPTPETTTLVYTATTTTTVYPMQATAAELIRWFQSKFHNTDKRMLRGDPTVCPASGKDTVCKKNPGLRELTAAGNICIESECNACWYRIFSSVGDLIHKGKDGDRVSKGTGWGHDNYNGPDPIENHLPHAMRKVNQTTTYTPNPLLKPLPAFLSIGSEVSSFLADKQ